MKHTFTTRLWLAALTAMAMLAALAGPGWRQKTKSGRDRARPGRTPIPMRAQADALRWSVEHAEA